MLAPRSPLAALVVLAADERFVNLDHAGKESARLLPVEQRCDLWPLAASREPYLMLLGPASFRTIPGYREVSVHRYLPATALTFDGLAEPPQPGEMILAANHATADPEAERKRKKGYRRMLKREEGEAARDGR